MTLLAQLISWLNAIGNGLFGLLEKPMTVLPPWFSLGLISAILGVFMLILFKYTSNQTAIGKARDAIKAHLLAMKLFKDSIPVVLKSQVNILLNAALLLFHSLRPMLIMIIPFSLFLGQLGLWYQSRPLAIGEQAIVTMQFPHFDGDSTPHAALVSSPIHEVLAGPVRVPSKNQIFWKIQTLPVKSGIYRLNFQVADQQVQKQLAVGDGFMPVSMKRPGLHIGDLILHPAEKPFPASSPVQSISIEYPDRPSKITGTDFWIVSLFVISMAAAFIFKPFFNVKI